MGENIHMNTCNDVLPDLSPICVLDTISTRSSLPCKFENRAFEAEDV